MHHAGTADIEHEFENKTGIAVAMGEGSQTNDSEKFKKQRRDCYAGKEIYDGEESKNMKIFQL